VKQQRQASRDQNRHMTSHDIVVRVQRFKHTVSSHIQV